VLRLQLDAGRIRLSLLTFVHARAVGGLLQAILDFRRRYGSVLTGYVLVAVAVWLLGIIVLPQAMMMEYSFWRLDRSHSAEMNAEIERLYMDKQKIERQIRSIDRELRKPDTVDRAPLEAQKAPLVEQVAEIEARLPGMEEQVARPIKVYGVDNYVHFLTSELHWTIFLKTIWASVIVTALAAMICYPVAYYIAHVAPGHRAPLLMLALIVPYWVNELLRTLAWLMILSDNGIANSALRVLGLSGLDWLNSDSGVIIGMTYAYVLFMIFPIYNTLETLDRNQLEAARDLGASWPRIHWRIAIPHAKPGIAVGCIMVFMLAAGSFAVPQILGGVRSVWFTQVIYAWFYDHSNWNMGATYAMGLLFLCIVFIMLMMRLFRVRLEDIARG
jgi:spermidine/putrescine transport system permease protein